MTKNRVLTITAPIPRPKRERVLKLEVEAAGTPVNRVVGKVEALVQKAQAKREIKKAGDSATTVEEKLDLVEERRVIEMNEKADEP